MEQAFRLLDSYAPLEIELRAFLAAQFKIIHYRKGEVLVKEGAVARYLGYIERGLIRGYRIDAKDHEFTSWFMMEGDVYASVRSFLQQRPATETVEAVEPTTIISLSYPALQEALRRWPSFHLHRAELLQKYYIQADEREEMRQQKAYDKFSYLMEHYSTLVQRVEDRYLASFLSLTPPYYSSVKSQYFEKHPRR